MTLRQLERLALAGHRRGDRWFEFWPSVAADVGRLAGYDRRRHRRLVKHLLHVLVSGDSPVEPIGSDAGDWDADDQATAEQRR